MSVKARFRLAFVALAAILALTYVAFFALPWTLPSVSTSAAPAIDAKDWGHVRAFNGQLTFILGPATDQRNRYELPLERVLFRAARMAVAEDEHGKGLVEIPGEIEGNGCILHFQGAGVNAQINVGKCVPGWAKTPDGAPAAQWIRVANLVPRPRVVFIKYDPQP